jgi:hypothetical protein
LLQNTNEIFWNFRFPVKNLYQKIWDDTVTFFYTEPCWEPLAGKTYLKIGSRLLVKITFCQISALKVFTVAKIQKPCFSFRTLCRWLQRGWRPKKKVSLDFDLRKTCSSFSKILTQSVSNLGAKTTQKPLLGMAVVKRLNCLKFLLLFSPIYHKNTKIAYGFKKKSDWLKLLSLYL